MHTLKPFRLEETLSATEVQQYFRRRQQLTNMHSNKSDVNRISP